MHTVYSLQTFIVSCTCFAVTLTVIIWEHSVRGTKVVHGDGECNSGIKQTHCRPGQALRGPGGSGAQISRQLAHEGAKVDSPTHRPPLTPENIQGTHFC